MEEIPNAIPTFAAGRAVAMDLFRSANGNWIGPIAFESEMIKRNLPYKQKSTYAETLKRMWEDHPDMFERHPSGEALYRLRTTQPSPQPTDQPSASTQQTTQDDRQNAASHAVSGDELSRTRKYLLEFNAPVRVRRLR